MESGGPNRTQEKIWGRPSGMNVIEDCLHLTQSIYEVLLDDCVNEEKRDERLTRLQTLLDRREEILPLIRDPFTLDEQTMGNEILRLNNLIQSAMVQNRNEIQNKITRLQASKSTVKKYVDPFGQVNKDGTFYDRVK